MLAPDRDVLDDGGRLRDARHRSIHHEGEPMRFGRQSTRAMLLAITLGSTPTAVLAGGEALDCTEEWYLCIAESAFDEDGEYRGDWSPGTVVETIECGLDYVRCRIRKLVFW